MKNLLQLIALLVAFALPALPGNGYQHFQVAVYARAYEVRHMDSLQWTNRSGTKSLSKSRSTRSILKPIATGYSLMRRRLNQQEIF